MEQLSLYIPGIMGLAFALVAFVSVRQIAGNRPVVRPAANEEGQDRFPFDQQEQAPQSAPEERLIHRLLGIKHHETTH
jgi:hypothetical protein